MAKRAKKKTGLFLQVVNGRMGMFVNEPNEYSEPVKDKNDKIKNYEFFDEISGMLMGVFCYDKKIKSTGGEIEMLVIQVRTPEGNKESLSMPFNSGYAESLIKRLEGIDVSKEITISTYKMLNEEKTKEKGKEIFNEGITIKQDGKKLENLYTKDSDKKLPEAVSSVKKEKGKPVTKWDFTEQKEAMREIVKAVNETVKSDTKETFEPINEEEHCEETDEQLAASQNENDLSF